MLAWQLPAGTVNCIQFTILFSLKASPPNHKGHIIKVVCASLSLHKGGVLLCEREDRMKHIMTMTHSIIHAIVQQEKVAKGAKEVYNERFHKFHIVTRLQPNVEHYNGIFPTYMHPSVEKESRC
jgi:hypothetical protein